MTMSIMETVAKLKSEGTNTVFKSAKKNIGYMKSMMPLLLQGSKRDIVSTLENNKRITESQPKVNSIESSMKASNAKMGEMIEIEKSNKIVTKLVLDELKIHTKYLKSIDFNTKNMTNGNGSRSPDLLNVADKFFNKKPRNKKPRNKKAGWMSPLVDLLTGNEDEDEDDDNIGVDEKRKSRNKATRRGKVFNKLANKVKNITKLATKPLARAGNSLVNAGVRVMSTRGGQVAGTIIRQGATRAVMAAAPLAAVAGAGAAGYAVGTAIYNNSSQGFKDAVGNAVANTLSFFGNKDAKEAVRVNNNEQQGSSTDKVATEKVGKVTMPKDENVKKALEFASKEFNIPLEELMATAFQESSFNPNAKGSGSSAAGLFQFTNSTWDELRKRFSAITDKYGIGSASSGDRFDPMKSAIMYGLLRKGNMQYLQKKGLTSGNSAVDSYLAHFLGMGGAAKVLGALSAGKGNDPISNYVSADAFNAGGNKPLMKGDDGRPRSVSDFITAIYNKSGAKADAYKEALNGKTNPSDKKVAPDKANPEKNIPSDKKGVESSSNTNPVNTPANSSNEPSTKPNAESTKSVPSAVNKTGNAVAALSIAESKAKGETSSAPANVPYVSSNFERGAGALATTQSGGTGSPMVNTTNGNVKATPNKTPNSVRDIPSTIQRILDNEYHRAI